MFTFEDVHNAHAANLLQDSEFGTVILLDTETGEAIEYGPKDFHHDGFVEVSDLDNLTDWTPLTGVTGQHGYNGPIMHESETVSPGMIQEILDLTEARYVAVTLVTVDDYDIDPDEFSNIVGWATLYAELPEHDVRVNICRNCGLLPIDEDDYETPCMSL